MPRRNVVFLLAAAAMAALCVRLGIWQLHRLAQRRRYNRLVASHLAEPPLSLRTVPSDTAARHYRRVRLSGTYDFSHQIILTDRVRDGAPGVDLVTPLHPDGAIGDTVVLVNRGWVYAADGMTVDAARWAEPPRLTGMGYLITLAPEQGPSTFANRPGLFRWLDRAAVEHYVGAPVHDYLIVLEPVDTVQVAARSAPPRIPVRVPPPPLDEGPHMSYAIQWFSFALIAIVGTVYALFIGPRRDRTIVPLRRVESSDGHR